MRSNKDELTLSASDLVNFLSCQHCANQDMLVARGRLKKPVWHDASLDALIQRGEEHEADYLCHLGQKGLKGVQMEKGTSTAETLEHMKEAMDYIGQARLGNEQWTGYADVLLKTSRPSDLGDWSYEVLDAKLSRETKGATVLQICLYSELLAELQGAKPELAYVLTPGTDYKPEEYRLSEYAAYYRLMKRQFVEYIAKPEKQRTTYPEPAEKCEFCEWWGECNKRRRKDDHLSFVAGVSRLQRDELVAQGIDTLEKLAKMPLPLTFKPNRGAVETYERVREQARLQLHYRETGELVREFLPPIPGQGLHLLPEPSKGDVYFDIEGDAFVGTQGFEYLFGYAILSSEGELQYQALRADSPAQEKACFQGFVKAVAERIKKFPDMHIYHYHSYEPGALKRLMGRYAVEEDTIDELLRAARFVDLHRVVKHTMRASVERYSIKDLEPFFKYERIVPLEEAGQARHALELALEAGCKLSEIPGDMVETVVKYNQDDCAATYHLQQWLEAIRSEQIGKGEDIPRPELKEGKPSAPLSEKLQEFQALGEALRQRLPDDPESWNPEERASWLLSHLPAFYNREDKALWWEYFEHCKMDDEELLDDKSALSALVFQERVEQRRGPVVDRYSFPPQDATIKRGDELHSKEIGVLQGDPWKDKFGKVVDIDYTKCTVDVEKAGNVAGAHPTSAFSHRMIRKEVLESALLDIAASVAGSGFGSSDGYRAAEALLANSPPRFNNGKSLAWFRGEIADPIELAETLAKELDHSVLGIQGPPGTGKTHTGARMILALVKAGKKVGITANSHKVIRNLLDKTVELAGKAKQEIRCIQKAKPKAEGSPSIVLARSNQDVADALEEGTAQVAGGTAWLWAGANMRDTVDVMFVDEAGQFSLANSLAVSHAAQSLVLLGDPQQLDQPLQGSHPDGVDVSGLEHLLENHPTMPEEKGLFLGTTRRMHPSVCSYIAEVFYEGKVGTLPGLENQALVHPAFPQGAGLWHLPVPHTGNQNSSTEEARAVAELVNRLLTGGKWKHADKTTHTLKLDDILVVTPYNAQVTEISKRLEGARVGTVDKFQGQEAPVVIVSYATSTPQDAPRGMDFLYSLNRLNVAVSRSKCASFVVASPELLKPECRSPKQMRLANGLCRFAEVSV